MDTYSVESDGNGGFQVRATRRGSDEERMVGSFPTWRQARDWIDNQTGIAMKSVTGSDLT